MSGRVLRRFRQHDQRVNAVQLDEAGKLLFSASYDGTMKVWDCMSNMREPIHTFREFRDSVSSIRLDGVEIVTGYEVCSHLSRNWSNESLKIVLVVDQWMGVLGHMMFETQV